MSKTHLGYKKTRVVLIFFAFLLGACSFPISQGSNGSGNNLFVPGPQSGRDAALNYIRDHYDLDVPFGATNWHEENVTPAEVTTSSVFEFTSNDWLVTVVYRVVDPSDRVYRISITNHSDFSWEGQVDSQGQVTETSVIQGRDKVGSVLFPTSIPEATQISTPTPTVEIISEIYRDEQYLIGFQYPSTWSLSTLPAGRNVGNGFAAKTLELTKGSARLLFQYKFLWERTVVGEDIPIGDIEIRRRISLFGIEIPVKYVVDNGLEKFIFFNGEKDDLEFGIYLSTETDGLTPEIQNDVDLIVASINRTGNPLPTPTISPTPKPTSEIAASRSGSGSGSTVTEDCNKASFVAHVTIPEGSLMLPGVQFTKIWRLRNVGTCTWTTAYSLAFSTGDLMGASKRVQLPSDVPPGSTVDISVEFTSPEKTGRYQGYWILNDPQGYWFGLGDLKNGFIPIDITVFEPTEEYAYDFAIHYCDATWKNNEMEDDQELPCPGSSSSSDGFVILIVNPELENRSENELALWVHPKEERNGWIRGIYPGFKVKNGDHFKAWVSCVADTNMCSIKFSLRYKDSNGDSHNLGSWIETLDGNVSKIDLDLSSLAGESVRFILITEALTNNVEAAQGLWFVPRIERP